MKAKMLYVVRQGDNHQSLRTLVQAIRLYNESALGDAPIRELPEDFWNPERSPAPGTLRFEGNDPGIGIEP